MKTNEYAKRRLTGMAGEWRVASELALRGLFPYFPGVDRGADLLINERVRVQVKCAHLAKRSVYKNGAYWFKLWKNIYATSVGKVQNRAARIFSDECDVVILWGIDEDRFWIVPANLLDGVAGIVLGPQVGYKRTDGLAQMEGMTQQQKADALGCSATTISRRLNGEYAQPKQNLSAAVRAYENRWDLIEALANLGESANAAASEELIEVTK